MTWDHRGQRDGGQEPGAKGTWEIWNQRDRGQVHHLEGQGKGVLLVDGTGMTLGMKNTTLKQFC